MSSIHCFYASDVALGKLICINRTDNDSKIAILGKDGTHTPECFLQFSSPSLPSAYVAGPSCFGVKSRLHLRLRTRLVLLRGPHVVQTLTPRWGTVSVLEPEDAGSDPDLVVPLCVTFGKRLSPLGPQLPCLLNSDDGDAGFPDLWRG